MKTKNYYLIIAGILNFLTFLLHLIGGQLDLVNPLLDSDLSTSIISEWVGVWNMITIVLLATSIALLYAGFKQKLTKDLITFIGYLNLSFCLPFIGSGFYFSLLVPQWIFFLPIGILTIIGIKKRKGDA